MGTGTPQLKETDNQNRSLSDVFQLPYGVPQGSFFGPFLFTLNTTPLSTVIYKFNVTHLLYADDTHLLGN